MGNTFQIYWRFLRENRKFRLLWSAQIVSELGDWFYSLAIYSLLLEMTGQATSVALAVIMQVLPQTLAGPTAGVVNDRVSRKRVMIAADLVRVVVVASMLLVRSKERVWLVYPLLVVETIAAAFFEPARTAVIPNIVEEEQVVVANTLSATTWSFNLAIGAALGGVVAVVLGSDAVFILNALTFAASAMLIARLRFTEPHMEGSAPLRARDLVDFGPVLEGIRYMRRDARLAASVLVKAGVGLLGARWVLYPVMGERLFPFPNMSGQRGTTLAMSAMMAASGVGALLGPVMAAGWAGAGVGGAEASDPRTGMKRLARGVLVGFLVAGAGTMLIATAPSLWVACAFIMASHAGAATVWVYSTTLLQRLSGDAYRGRVFAAELGLAMLAIAASCFSAGAAIDHGVPIRMVVAVSGALVLVPAAVWALRWGMWGESD